MQNNPRYVHPVLSCLAASLLASCGGSGMSGVELGADEVKTETLKRVQSSTTVLASDQHIFRYDGQTSRTFTLCDGTVCAVSPTAQGLPAALERARTDVRLDFGNHHFASRLEDSLELKDATRPEDGITIVEGFGSRPGDRAFRAKFFGGWLDEGAFFVNETILTVRDGRGQPVGLGTVYDSSAMGVAAGAAPAPVRGMSTTWVGTMIGADVSDTVTRGQFLRGDATLVIDDLAMPEIDITFSNLHDLGTGAAIEDRTIASWQNVPVSGGSFGNKPAGSDDYIQGRFAGENHSGVVGVFERNEIVGSFGGNRKPSNRL